MNTYLTNLRPLSLGELLDQGIRIYRRNFVKFVGIMAIVQIPLALLTMFSNLAFVAGIENNYSSNLAALASLGGSCLVIIIGMVQAILVNGFASSAIVRAAADHYLGKSFGIIESYKRIGMKWLWVIVAYVILVLVGFGIGIWMLVPVVGWFTGPGMLIFLSMVTSQLLLPIIVLEDQDVLASVRRAWDLSRLRFWWMVGFALVLFLISTLLITVPVYVVSFGAMGFLPTSENYLTSQIMSTILTSLVGIITSLLYTPFQLSLVTSLYFDLRVRFEAFDLALMASGAEDEDGKDVIARTPPAPQAEKLITGTELGYFAIISLGGIALYVIVVMILVGIVMLAMPALY